MMSARKPALIIGLADIGLSSYVLDTISALSSRRAAVGMPYKEMAHPAR